MSADRLALQIKKRSCRVVFSGILFHKLDIVPVRNEANVLTVVLPGVAESQTIFYKGIMPSEKVLDFPVDCNTLTGSVNL